MSVRTDLAIELTDGEVVQEGIRRIKRGEKFEITEIVIDDDKYGVSIGKRAGHYVTMEAQALSSYSDDYKEMVLEFAKELQKFTGDKGLVLIVGLGNDDITPDALGPAAASGVMATRHLKKELPDDEFFAGLREVSVLLSGVLGTTGIESAEIVKAVKERISPDLIIVIDALACSEVSRLGKTIQICDTGISPGSGVENKRKELSDKTLGIPVIAIGVPTIVDMHTIVEELTGRYVNPKLPNMMVTPKDIDKLISHASKLIATGINLALQPSLTFEDAAELAG
ncbi:MAG: GPR endopeptidase [Oscillospiraceae bacterium]|nr:GPR endopeptidase [Oscillospiraceae bacterium]